MSRIIRCYLPHAQDVGTLVASPEVSRHLCQVLRLRKNEVCEVFNGQGQAWQAVIQEAHPKATRLELQSLSASNIPLPKCAVSLAVSCVRPQAMDWLIEKSTELGVLAVYPLNSAFTVRAPKQWEKKQQHWERLVVSACQQSGRNTLMTLHPPQSLESFLGTAKGHLYVASLNTENTLLQCPDSCTVLIGPEGGWSPEEETLLAAHAQPVKFMTPLLRTETAALAVCAKLLL